MPDHAPLVVCAGEVLVDFIAQERGTDVGSARTFIKSQGGAVANVAVGLARLGARSRFVGKVGADPFGRFLKRCLSGEGVDLRWLIESGYPTGLVFVILDEARVPRFCFFGDPSADMMLSDEEVSPETVSGACFLHVGTVSMVGEVSRKASFKLIELAAASKVKLSFDPNLRLHLWKDHELLKRLALEVISSAALVKVNEEELVFLTGLSSISKGAARLQEQGAEVVVVTRGPAGAYFLCPQGEGEAKGFPVPVEDTTGAGDGFVAGLLLSLAENGSWPPSLPLMHQAVEFANAVGALVTTKVGAVSALPSRDQVEKFLSQQKNKCS